MQIAELKFGDVGRGLARYRPVGLAALAIIGMAIVLPGPERVAGNAFDLESFDSAPSPVAAIGDVAGGADAAIPAEAAEAFAAPGVADSSFSSSFSAPSTPSSSFDVDLGPTRSDTDSSTSSGSSSSSTFESSAPPPATTTTRPASQPLALAQAGWVSEQAGTPLASAGVPAGSFPVGRRPGFAEDKVALVRLSGNTTMLRLVPHPDASGQRSPETAGISACRMTGGGWQATGPQAKADVPTWDCTVSVQGRRSPDGAWVFDLSVFADRADSRGFALVPTGDAVDYQVAFAAG